MDKATLASMALGLLGEQEYLPDTPNYEAVELYFAQTLRGLLAGSDWSFARRRRQLHRRDDGTYKIPPDCLRIVELQGLRSWRKYEGMIMPEDCEPYRESVTVIYTSSHMVDCGEIPDNLPEFIACFVELLAAAMSVRVLNDKRRRMEHLQLGDQLRSIALTHDIQQDNSNDQHPLDELLRRGITD